MIRTLSLLMALLLGVTQVALAQGTTRTVDADYIRGSDVQRNYVRYGLGDLVSGWSTYNDSAAVPVDATGGTVNAGFTWTSSTSAPLVGARSFILSKDAANRQGHGVSYAFTIDNIDKSQSLCLAMDIEASASVAAGDFVAYFYDVTNATLITPTVTSIPSGTTREFKSCFIPTTSSSYRVAFHTATTSTTALTLKIDNVRVSRQTFPVGTVVTDWVGYIPSITASSSPTLGAGAIVEFFWRRVGDSLELTGRFTQTVAGSAGSGTYVMGLPSGIDSDTTKIGGRGSTGIMNIGSGSVSLGTGSVIQAAPKLESTGITLVLDDSVSANSSWSAASAYNFGTTNLRFSFFARFPVVGWSSNVQMLSAQSPEYVYNSNTATGGDSTSFAYGSSGGLVPAITQPATPNNTEQAYRVRFQTALQPYEDPVIEFQRPSTTTWMRLGLVNDAIQGFNYNGGVWYGVYLVQVNSTDVDVKFGTAGGRIGNAAYGSTTGASYNTWTTINSIGWKYRVTKAPKGSGAMPINARNIVGDTAGTVIPQGIPGESGTVAFTCGPLTGSANTDTDCTGTVTLQPGNYEIGYDALGYITNTTAGAVAAFSRLKLTDTSNNVVDGTVGAYGSNQIAVSAQLYANVSRRGFINISSATTYKMRIANNFSTANVESQVIGVGFTGALTDPDNNSRIWWRRL